MRDEDGVLCCPWCGNGPIEWPDTMFGVCTCCRKGHRFNLNITHDTKFRPAGIYCSRCLKKSEDHDPERAF